jgi:hypothetical protein
MHIYAKTTMMQFLTCVHVCVCVCVCVQMEDVFTRAVKGGSGGIKAVGNYAGSLLPQVLGLNTSCA